MQCDDGRLGLARNALAEALGAQAVVEASGIVSNFQRMNRIANATGIPIDPAANEKGEERRNEMNNALGISAYPSAEIINCRLLRGRNAEGPWQNINFIVKYHSSNNLDL